MIHISMTAAVPISCGGFCWSCILLLKLRGESFIIIGSGRTAAEMYGKIVTAREAVTMRKKHARMV